MSRYAHTRNEQGRFRPSRPLGLCVYCGALTPKRVNGAAVCGDHEQIVLRDPHYMELDQWKLAR